MKPQAKKVMVIVGILVVMSLGLFILDSKISGKRVIKEADPVQTEQKDEEGTKTDDTSKQGSVNAIGNSIIRSDAVVLAKKDGVVTLSIDNPNIKESVEFATDDESFSKIYIGQTFELDYSLIDGVVKVNRLRVKQ